MFSLPELAICMLKYFFYCQPLCTENPKMDTMTNNEDLDENNLHSNALDFFTRDI